MVKMRSAIQIAQAKLQGEIAKVVQSVRNEYQAALAQENSLTGALDQQKREALAMNRKAIDYGVLERDVQSSKQIYESLLQRAKETGVSGELKTSNIRVVDAAEMPRDRPSPRKLLNLTLALFGGSILAVGLAFFFEYLDSRIKTPEEIRTHLGPAAARDGAGARAGIVAGQRTRSSATASRRISPRRSARSGPTCSSRPRRKARARSSSPAPGPARARRWSRPTSRLALAQAGQRVLLIDADMRRPRVHEVFSRSRSRGCRTCWSATRRPARASARPACRACGC